MNRLKKQTIVADFDGTVTDTHKEAVTYRSAYYQLLGERLSVPVERIRELMQVVEDQVISDPATYGGWQIDGVIVATTTDPYSIITNSAKMTLAHLRQEMQTGVVHTLTNEDDFISEMYFSTYHCYRSLRPMI